MLVKSRGSIRGGRTSARPITRKGKKILQSREPKVVENTKVAMFLKGASAGQIVGNCLKDLFRLKKPHGIMFQRKNYFYPFEDESGLERLGGKFDASLFAFGSHSKKRHDNLILGRMYDGNVLDMFEFGVENYQSIDSFSGLKSALGTKPCLSFVGELWWETGTVHQRLKNFFVDFFRGDAVTKLRLQGLESALNFTILDDGRVLVRTYRIELKKSGTRVPRVELVEVGPKFDLVPRRNRIASDDLFKAATRQPAQIKAKPRKNTGEDVFGSRVARVHVGRQDVDRLQTRKMKGLKKTRLEQETLPDTLQMIPVAET